MRMNLKMLAVAAVLAAALTGCGGAPNPENQSSSKADETPASSASSEPGNTEQDTTETTPEGKTLVKPLQALETANQLENGACRVSFNQEKGDVIGTPDSYQFRVTVYQYDRYKPQDLKNLKAGDQLRYHDCKTAAWKTMTIKTIEFYSDEVSINGGCESGEGIGMILEDGLYVRSDMNHIIGCYPIGTRTLPVAADVVMTDDEYGFNAYYFKKGYQTATSTGASAVYQIVTLPRTIRDSKGSYLCSNTYVSSNCTVTLKNGKIVKLYRNYLP